MKIFLYKAFLPWKAGDCFASEAQFQTWLRKRHRSLADLRALMLVLAAGCLLAGYFLDRSLLLRSTIIPLALALLLSMALARIEAVLGGQNIEEDKKE